MAEANKPDGPVFYAVNPGSLLGTKMVKEAFGIAGAAVQIGSDIVTRAALSASFNAPTGSYFDNDAGKFASPHPDARDDKKSEAVVQIIEKMLPKS